MAEAKPREDGDDIIRSEAEVLEIAREVLGRYSERLEDGPAPFFRAGFITRSDATGDTENSERR